MTGQQMKQNTLEKIGKFLMSFGKHKGKTYKELHTNEQQYIRQLRTYKDTAFNKKSIECFLKYMNIMSNLDEEIDEIKEDNERQRSKFIDSGSDSDELVDSDDDELVDSYDDKNTLQFEIPKLPKDQYYDWGNSSLEFTLSTQSNTVNKSVPIDIIKKTT